VNDQYCELMKRRQVQCICYVEVPELHTVLRNGCGTVAHMQDVLSPTRVTGHAVLMSFLN
jgi:hypothetical protein